MMTTALLFAIGIFLLIVTVIDFKTKAIPSIFLTGMLFVVAFVQADNIVPFGILSIIFAFLLYESTFYEGMADVKVTAILGLLISSYIWMIVYILMILIVGIIWKVGAKYILKEKQEVAFLVVFLITFVSLWTAGAYI